jgi:hypothetical protein
MAELVYSLCTITSLICTLLLFRAFQRTQIRFIFWSCICFAGFTLNNGLLFVDLVLFPTQINLSIPRTLPAFFGLIALVFGLISDST